MDRVLHLASCHHLVLYLAQGSPQALGLHCTLGLHLAALGLLLVLGLLMALGLHQELPRLRLAGLLHPALGLHKVAQEEELSWVWDLTPTWVNQHAQAQFKVLGSHWAPTQGRISEGVFLRVRDHQHRKTPMKPACSRCARKWKSLAKPSVVG